eukprot:1196247-Prorocentrum_minimum.AAC.5
MYNFRAVRTPLHAVCRNSESSHFCVTQRYICVTLSYLNVTLHRYTNAASGIPPTARSSRWSPPLSIVRDVPAYRPLPLYRPRPLVLHLILPMVDLRAACTNKCSAMAAAIAAVVESWATGASPLADLTRVIFSLPFRDWCPLR